ncbi:hypothetical protein [Arthrobacter koreensis]
MATFVLSRSNRHQLKLAKAAAKEQRDEAARSREQAALAEVLIATEGLMTVVKRNSPEGVQEYWPVLTAAMARWRVELGSGDMEQEIKNWPLFLRTTAFKGVSGKATNSTEWSAEFWKLGTGIRLLSSVVLAWPEASQAGRQAMREELRVFRLESERPSA